MPKKRRTYQQGGSIFRGKDLQQRNAVDNNNTYMRQSIFIPPKILTEEEKRALIAQDMIKKQGTIKGITKEEFEDSKSAPIGEILRNPMTAIKRKLKGQDLPKNFSKDTENKNPYDYATAIVNPLTYWDAVTNTAKNIVHPVKTTKTLAKATANLATNLVDNRNMYNDGTNEEAIQILGDAAVAVPAVKGAQSAYKGMLGAIDRNFTSVGRQLEKIRIEGESAGLDAHSIAKKQMEEVGITSNQRKGYNPVISNFAEKYITPYSYEGFDGESKLTQVWKNIKAGGIRYADSYDNPMRLGQSKARADAWRLYLGKPQLNNTFSLSETAPVNHPSYTPNIMSGMDVYNINNTKGIIPKEYFNVAQSAKSDFQPGISPSSIDKKMGLLRNKINIDRDGDIMGGYNKLLSKEGLQYNDIWDLKPYITPVNYLPSKLKKLMDENPLFYKTTENGKLPRTLNISVDKFLGKPFMSHGNLSYTSENLTDNLRNLLTDQIKKMKDYGFDMHPKIAKYQDYLQELKNYPKFKKGGTIRTYQMGGNYVQYPYPEPFDFTGLRNFKPMPAPEPITQEQQNRYNWGNLNPQETPRMPQPELSSQYTWMNNFDGSTTPAPVNPNAIKTYDISAQTGYNPQNALNNGQVPVTPAADKDAVDPRPKKKKFDPFFALRGATTGLSWLANKAERNRQDQYMYNQYSTLGQLDPVNINDYQPTPYNQYFQEGGTVDGNPYKDYYSEYMKSPKYKAMLGDNPEVSAGRIGQLGKFTQIKVVPNTFFGSGPKLKNGFIVGEWNKDTNTVNVNERLNPARIPGVVSHEVSHQIDNGGQFIPQKDIDFMSSLKRAGLESSDEINYLSQPTEIRARLNQLRYKSKERGVYDPFTEDFKAEFLDKFKNATEMNDLRKLYSDEDIIKLMNSVSQTGDQNMTMAQRGGTIIVNNPNDPRLRAYQDSLNLYNTVTKQLNKNKNVRPDWINTNTKVISNEEAFNKIKNSTERDYLSTENDRRKFLISPFNKDVEEYIYGENLRGYRNLSNDPSLNNQSLEEFRKMYSAKNQKYIDEIKKSKIQPLNFRDSDGIIPIRGGNGQQTVIKDGVMFPVYKKPVQPVVYQKEPQLKRMPVTPIELLRPESLIGSGTINSGAIQTIPQQEGQYRVEYTDPETGERTHRDFPNEKQGSDFQKLIGGDREGYWLGYHKKGGWISDALRGMRKDKPCTGEKFGSESCPPGSKRYNLAKTFRKMAKNR